MKRTKIVCTIGPATANKEILKRMMKAGMNVGRFNFSHGSFEDQERYFTPFIEARNELGLPPRSLNALFCLVPRVIKCVHAVHDLRF